MLRLGRRRIILLVAVTFAIAATILLSAFVLTFQGKCWYDDYTIMLRPLPAGEIPSPVVNLTTAELEAYPLIEDVLAAYWNTSRPPGAYFSGDSFFYPILTLPENRTVWNTHLFLRERWGGASGLDAIAFTTGDGEYFEWYLLIKDPGPLLPCP